MKKGFTLLEVVIVVIVILILSTVGIAGYKQVLDNAYQRVCGVNQMCLIKAVENHFLTEGIAPATLGNLDIEHIHKAYTEVMQEAGWQARLAYAFIRFSAPREACAEIDELKDFVDINEMAKYGIRAEIMRCPAKRGDGVSYGINTALRGYSRWKNVPLDTVIIADCENTTFAGTDYTFRHIKNLGTKKLAQGITKGKRKITEEQTTLNTIEDEHRDDYHDYDTEHDHKQKLN
jgi:prepilin-type N-terminal cleavage/methylation domain-containing protein